MSQFLQLFILVPLFGFLASLLIPRKKENYISRLAISVISIHLACVALFAATWLFGGQQALNIKHFVFFRTTGFEIFIDFYYDRITAVFSVVGATLALISIIFSRYYLHREEGFKRFFTNMLLFYTGYNLVIFSGNFETLFIGWELLGISSFLLIAFYRDRYLPVKNGLKVISIYRLSDICLLTAMWLSHHLWHENITFIKLNDMAVVSEQIRQQASLAIAVSIMIIIAAAIKSAQLPFSSWLPRAMEGPGTSSAIFYGSLSVHIGVFLLLRTYPLWQDVFLVKAIIIVVGLTTCLVAAGIAGVQSSVKTQIAYSSIAQIGIMFIEVALGFHALALFHFAGNACLRTYQILVSPSVLSYLVHDQFYHFVPRLPGKSNKWIAKIRNSIYILSVKEWNLDFFLYKFLWSPFKWVGRRLLKIHGGIAALVLAIVFFTGLYSFMNEERMSAAMYRFMPVIISMFGLLLLLHSFAERRDARQAWLQIFASQFFIVLAVLLNDRFGAGEVFIYLGGTIVSGISGYLCLNNVRSIDKDISLNRFHGYVYEQPTVAFLFLLSCLGLLGFPITPTFIGIDLMFSHINSGQMALVIFTALSFVFVEISALRIYARIFLGQHKKPFHAIAYRSS